MIRPRRLKICRAEWDAPVGQVSVGADREGLTLPFRGSQAKISVEVCMNPRVMPNCPTVFFYPYDIRASPLPPPGCHVNDEGHFFYGKG
ncbi:MAG: hypothetical protein K0S58_1153 [Nitrospira sp.]|nr:hypothetical protein [Nitrospira sp.]